MKIHLYILILGLTFLSSCNRDKPNPFDKSLIGEWMLDSISGPFDKWDRDFVYITDNGNYWKFTYWNDRYLIDSCYTVNSNKILQNNKRCYQIQLIDSFKMLMADNFGNTFFYRNIDRKWESNYKDDLRDFISQDSIHQKINGWWKLTKATFRPIKLVNYPDKINDFTIHLNKNGAATVYIDNLVDSTIDYSWQTKPSSLSFGRLCIVGAESPIVYLDDYKLVSIFSKYMDTLTFERCQPLLKE